MTGPSVGVVLVAWREEPRLAACLAALGAAAGPVPVLIVHNEVDPDGPRVEPWAGVVHWRRRENPGFTGGFADGMARLDTPFLLSLTPDARLAPGALEAAIRALRSDDTLGAVAFRLLRPGGDVLDSAGIRLGLFRSGTDRGIGRSPVGRYVTPEIVDAACMACALFRRDALDEARDGAGDVLDQRFFVYKEDVDLGWRLSRAGRPVLYEPAAVAEHERGFKERGRRSMSVFARRLSLRNRWLTWIKNESALGLVWRLPLILAREVGVLLWLGLFEREVLPAYGDVWRELLPTWKRRSLPCAASSSRRAPL